MFNLFKKIEGAAREVKASAVGKVVAFSAGRGVAWSPRDTGSLTRLGFVGNPVGFRAVRLIAEAAAGLPIALMVGGGRVAVHPALELLARPNPGQSRAELFEAIYASLLLSGDAWIEAVNGTGLPQELHVLRADRMSIVPGPDGWPEAYDYAVGGKKHRFFCDEGPPPICHIRSFHPLDDHYGLSPMQAAASALDVHTAASRWSKALLDNAARPSGAIVYRGSDGQGAMSPEQFDRLASELATHHQGAANAGRPMLLEGGLDWKPMGFSPSDMEFHRTKEAAAREIATAFGVPPMLLGVTGDATYANYQEANRAFYRLTVLPLAGRVCQALGQWLSDHLGEAIELHPDLDQVPALGAEREALWSRISAASFLSDVEKRMILGLSRPEDCDTGSSKEAE